ncbi:MAG: site-2 protease family protein [Pirellulaceae bacterium]|nr:site-2 protease family protein [Pirellulaceae bacterium]
MFFLAEPPPTPYDLNFQVLGFPVRVHPFFWLVGFVMGFQGLGGEPIGIVIWIVVLFSSILIHELGHALMMRHFGRRAHIVLHWMGGLAIEGGSSPYSSYSSFDSSGFGRRRTPGEQILISFAGPAAGFLLAGVVVGLIYASGGRVLVLQDERHVPWLIPMLGGELARNANLNELARQLLYVNVLWGLVNLLPVLPLDGGQIAQQLLVVHDPYAGMMRALWLSVIVGAAAALLLGFALESMFVAMFFGSLAVSAYFTLQQFGGRGRPW